MTRRNRITVGVVRFFYGASLLDTLIYKLDGKGKVKGPKQAFN